MTTTATESRLTRLSVETEGAVVRIRLRNPPVNVIDITMMEELAQVLAEIETQNSASVIVFCGDGRAFSAGVDIGAHTPDKISDMLAKFHGIVRSVMACRKVTVAA